MKEHINKIISLAVVPIFLVSAFLSGCSSSNNQGSTSTSTSTSTTGGVLSQINAPTGTVIGLVQDTNGNPIEGADVYLGGQTTRTNAGGQYIFNDVAATNTVNLAVGVTQNQLVISIVPPAGYLGASVTVTPEAQIDGNVSSPYSSTNPVTTFISGYIAQAGTAVLPKLQVTVTGVLRDVYTGQPLPNTELTMDMWDTIASPLAIFSGLSINVPSLPGANAVKMTYATNKLIATTDAKGIFSFTNVAEDSFLSVQVKKHVLNSISSNTLQQDSFFMLMLSPGDVAFQLAPLVVDTFNTPAVVDIGDVLVTQISSSDTLPPYVAGVSGLANSNMFDNVTTGLAGITITFSEAIKPTPDNIYQVSMVDVTTGALLTNSATLAADGLSLSLTTAAPMPLATNIDINLLAADFHDLSDNAIVVSGAGAPNVTYDASVTSATGSQYLQLNMQSWRDAVIGATAVTASTQNLRDNLGIDDFAALQALNPVFNDAWDGDILVSDFQGLNSAADDNGDLANDAEIRLSALATAIQGGVPVSVVSNQANVSFTPSNAVYYAVTVTTLGVNVATADMVSNNVVPFDPAAPLAAPATIAAAGGTFKVSDANPVSLIIGNVNPGDTVTITPFDDLGYQGTPISTVLRDNIEPTTVLQPSYGLAIPQPFSVVPAFGNGGQLAGVPAGTLVGTPYLTLTAGLLDNINPVGNSLAEELLASNTIDPVTNLPFISSAFNAYDAAAFAAMNNNRTIGIAVSEDIALTATAPIYGGAQVLSNWAANNNVFVDDNGVLTNVDLVNFDVADIFAMANTDHGSTIDLSNSIQDLALTPNVGTVASVVVQDRMPPMVTSAFYNGSNITINFNEIINPQLGDVLLIGVSPITISQATVDTFALSANKSQLVINAADWGGNLNLGTTFALPTYGGNDHASFDFTQIQDIRGVSWINAAAGVASPNFAIASNVPKVASVTELPTGYANPATVFSIAYTFTHQINLTALGLVSNGTPIILTGAQVALMFTPVGSAINPALSSGTLSADGKVLTINFDVTPGAVAIGNTMTLNAGSVTSAYDNTQSAALTVTSTAL